ncbi:MAG: fumarylacetoacetate hydrolase family protein [Acidimicrobiaceae bacterium]|nr:fumarylacetoacetate hydrolase family protein [Acidimicrobiaceae bacterium]
MQLVTLRQSDGQTSAGRLEGGQVVPLPFEDVGALVRSGEDWQQRALQGGQPVPLTGAAFAPVVPYPSKVICVGLNYLLHIKEGGGEVPTHPTLFAKFTDALTGPYDDIILPAASERVDWEAELVIVIGRRVRNATGDDAAGAIAGFTIGNDVSMRDWQRRTTEWLQGKTWEASSPVGPALVTVDEVGSPRPDLAVSCLVDGETMQDARTSDLLFDPVELVAYASTVVTLRPGDLIFTGTPEGVGAGRTPPRFLRPGEVVTTRIEALGQMENRFVSPS